MWYTAIQIPLHFPDLLFIIYSLVLPPLQSQALHPLHISPLVCVLKAEPSTQLVGCGSLLNHSHGTG